ncbi:hypothetical protein K456DRAFT_58595 [Colletotrichum gloeosporioides 23]|nr:hypothetical protein K456DRAFT_58595 [Colletotrichum gloeosporioides 23]
MDPLGMATGMRVLITAMLFVRDASETMLRCHKYCQFFTRLTSMAMFSVMNTCLRLIYLAIVRIL